MDYDPEAKTEKTREASLRHSAFHFSDVLWKRSLGLKNRTGTTDEIVFKTYNSFNAFKAETRKHNTFDFNIGGIFNLEFSFDGKLVIAACEGKQILLYDAANQRQINYFERAHEHCVNCIRFLTDRTFATCSDDMSIKIWDIRNMKNSVKSLYGHSNWVKNIEWSEQEHVLVTSAFDGSIYSWNINEYGESNNKVFLMNGLMRMKLTPDGTKMIISTTNGYMIIIHNLNLMTLATDLKSFRPNVYRLMQTSDQSFPVGTLYNYLFSAYRKRNRIEFIDDFPNEAEVISSLDIHPHGWSAVSRNLNGTENEEWTTVHDIQDRDPSDYQDMYTIASDCEDSTEEDNPTEEPSNTRPTDLWLRHVYLNDIRYDTVGHHPELDNINSMNMFNSGLIGVNNSYNDYFEAHPEEKNKIIKNLPRMTHYMKELTVGRGFIKELSFSNDGRVIASPYGRGIRLLAFNEKCSELSSCVPEKPQQLKTIVEMKDYHRDTVVSCKFSPVHYQLVSGCLGSGIEWYQPVL